MSTSYALETVPIPNAICGNGSQYSVFIDKQSDEKLFIEFMGGGVCWDFESCFVNLHTWIYPIPNLLSLSLFTDNSSKLNFLKGHSKIYFPYCTGDIHVGKHQGGYAFGTHVAHNGYNNVVLALEYLRSTNRIKFNHVNDLVTWGASAGGLAAMMHSKMIERMVPGRAHKTMLVDSPGLHWGKDFWRKFPKEMIHDFEDAFSSVGVKIDFDDGFVAKDLGGFFRAYSQWSIGFLLGTRDLIMSRIFGDISQVDQANLILSRKGLPRVADGYGNVNVWVRDTEMHTFLLLSATAGMKSFDGITAIDFSRKVYQSH